MCNCCDIDSKSDKIETIYLIVKVFPGESTWSHEQKSNVCFFTDEYQAKHFIEEQNRLLGYVKKFAETQKTNPLKIPDFSRPEPVIDLVKRKELTDAMNNGEDRKQRRAAGKAFERFQKEFDLAHSEWLKEKNKHISYHMRCTVLPIIGKDDFYLLRDDAVVTKIIDLYIKGELHYTDFIYEFEAIQAG